MSVDLPSSDAAAVAVSIVVPVRNEAENVSPLIAEIAAALDGRWAYEIIYVNDGSTDATAERLAAIMKQRGNLRQIRHATSSGQSAAVRSGVRAARGAIVATLDGDGQNNPAFLPDLISAIENGGERVGLAAGQRVGRKDTGFKKIQSRIANGVRNAILRDGTRDTGCGLKAFRREVFLMMPYFDGLHRFLPALVRREGYEIAYVDVIDRPRHSGVSNYGFFDRLWIGIMDLAGVWWLIRRKKPTPVATEVTSMTDLFNTLATYLHDVFVIKFDGWVILGFVAQGFFTMRFVVQWIASERARKSVIPVAFWFFSIGGGVLLLVYALYRRDPVFIAGQALGLVVYVRNLYFIIVNGRQAARWSRWSRAGLRAAGRDAARWRQARHCATAPSPREACGLR